MTPIEQMRNAGNAQKALEMSSYHKGLREFLGLTNPQIDDFVKQWRFERDVAERVNLSAELWQSNIHEARIAAAKLLIQARLKPSDEAAWQLIIAWVPEFDAWAIADHAASAGARRLVADPSRLDTVEKWVHSDHMWSRRAALVMTLPWAKLNHLSSDQHKDRERILGWAASYVSDPEWFIQKSIGWWIRDLSKHDPARAQQFLEKHSHEMAAFSRKIAAKYLA